MQENGPDQGFSEHFLSPDAVRLLWEGTRKALDGGVDHEDLMSLCDIIVRLADHHLLFMQVKCDPAAAEFHAVAEQLRRYRNLASDLFQWAKKPAPEPDWPNIAERLRSVAGAPLEGEGTSRE